MRNSWRADTPIDAWLPSLRPQSVMLTFMGEYIEPQNVYASAQGILAVLARVGITDTATRATLSRMVQRGLLLRQRRGRSMYFGLTRSSQVMLRAGTERIWEHGAVNDVWDGTWTLVAFSVPDSGQRQRHSLRSKLVWAGFGPLQGGLWIAPGQQDVAELVRGSQLDTHIKAFTATSAPPTQVEELINEAYDLAGLARRFQAFLERWDGRRPTPAAPDDLARQLLMMTEWLQIVRHDPRLPVQHLPADWPAKPAQQVFRQRHAEYDRPARAILANVLRTVPAQD